MFSHMGIIEYFFMFIPILVKYAICLILDIRSEFFDISSKSNPITGVLVLDESPEFKIGVLEVMRQALEDREVMLSRARFTIS